MRAKKPINITADFSPKLLLQLLLLQMQSRANAYLEPAGVDELAAWAAGRRGEGVERPPCARAGVLQLGDLGSQHGVFGLGANAFQGKATKGIHVAGAGSQTAVQQILASAVTIHERTSIAYVCRRARMYCSSLPLGALHGECTCCESRVTLLFFSGARIAVSRVQSIGLASRVLLQDGWSVPGMIEFAQF